MDQGSVLATLTAAGWAALASGALMVGAVVALLMPVNLRVIGAIMGFGAGVLMGAAAFELTAEAMATAGLAVSGLALTTGALVYLAGDWAVGNAGAHRRMSPLHPPPSPQAWGMRCSATSARCFSAARRRSRRGPSWR